MYHHCFDLGCTGACRPWWPDCSWFVNLLFFHFKNHLCRLPFIYLFSLATVDITRLRRVLKAAHTRKGRPSVSSLVSQLAQDSDGDMATNMASQNSVASNINTMPLTDVAIRT
jgi:hypothetical protein